MQTRGVKVTKVEDFTNGGPILCTGVKRIKHMSMANRPIRSAEPGMMWYSRRTAMFGPSLRPPN